MGCIYGIQNKVNHKWYIGKCADGIAEKRKRAHYNGRGSQELKGAIDKYGIENFTFHRLHDGIISELLNSYEVETIAKYNSVVPNGYNKTIGGGGILGHKHSEETRKKTSEALKGRQFSNEHLSNLSKSNKGENNPNYGKTPSPKTREKQSKALKGRQFSDKHRKNISKSLTGKVAPNRKPEYDEAKAFFLSLDTSIFTTEKQKCLCAKYPHISQSLIRKWIRRWQQETGQKTHGQNKHSPAWRHQAQIIKLYTVDLLSTRAIGKIFNVSKEPITSILKSNNIKLRTPR